jgi:mRNA interferase HicA
MKGAEFIQRVQRYAKAQGLACRVDQKRGKGSHVTLYLGDRLTIVRNPKDELKTGTLHAMLKQLGLSLSDL